MGGFEPPTLRFEAYEEKSEGQLVGVLTSGMLGNVGTVWPQPPASLYRAAKRGREPELFAVAGLLSAQRDPDAPPRDRGSRTR